MTRPTTGFCFHERRIVWGESAGPLVEFVNENLVCSEIGHDRETIVGRNIDRMRMRLVLEGRVPAMPDVLHERGLLTEGAVIVDANHGDAAAAKIRHHRVMAGLVDREIAGACTSSGQRVYQAQLASGLINCERADVRSVIEIWPQ